jgi:hypothetical protein
VSTSFRDSVLKTIRAFPGGWDAVSAALGMTRNQLENRVYERRDQELGSHAWLMMQKFTNTHHVIAHLAVESGGTFVKLPDLGNLCENAAQEKLQELVVEIGQLFSTYREAMEDHLITDKEQGRLNEIVDQINRTTLEFKALTLKCHGVAKTAEVKHG